MSVIATPEPRHPKRGSPTALAWGSNDQDSFEYLVSGTVNGYLCIIKRMSGSVSFTSVQRNQDILTHSDFRRNLSKCSQSSSVVAQNSLT